MGRIFIQKGVGVLCKRGVFSLLFTFYLPLSQVQHLLSFELLYNVL